MTQGVPVGTSKIIRKNFNGLNSLVKALGDGRVVKVGILGRKAGRKDSGDLTNAELGAIHEFGSFSKKIPSRSFLRMPIHQNAEIIAREAGKGSAALVEKGDMVKVLEQIGLACKVAILRAFDSAGFGQWKPDKPATIRRKKSATPLIDSSQLRRSIDYAVGKPQ